jgi:hypothetical protein
MKSRKYRFFYHYYKQYGEMSIHFKGVCYRSKNVECLVPCETKWNTTQPNLIMRGWATSIEEINDKIIIR